jgi:hypothetical protein
MSTFRYFLLCLGLVGIVCSPVSARQDSLIDFSRDLDELQDTVACEGYTVSPLTLSYKPGYSLGFGREKCRINIIGLGLIGGRAAKLRGVEFALGGNLQEVDAVGAQVAGLGNVVTGSMFGIQLSGLGNVTQGLSTGLFIAGLGNVSEGGLGGAQFSFLGNVSTGETWGLQLSGLGNVVSGGSNVVAQTTLLGNVADGDLWGSQFSFLGNVVDGRVRGIQWGAVANVSSEDLIGVQLGTVANVAAGGGWMLQFAGVANVAERVNGIQASGVANVAERARGIQVSLVANVAGELGGIQVGLVNGTAGEISGIGDEIADEMDIEFPDIDVNISEMTSDTPSNGHNRPDESDDASDGDEEISLDIAPASGIMRGFQVGWRNHAEDMRGIQIGVYNTADECSGYPIGLATRVMGVPWRWGMVVNEAGIVSAELRSGRRDFRTIASVGVRPVGDTSLYTYGIGFGPRFHVDGIIDYLYATVSMQQYIEDGDWKALHMVNSATLRSVWLVSERLAVTAGVSLNMLVSHKNDGADIAPWSVSDSESGGTWTRIWPSVSVGLEF